MKRKLKNETIDRFDVSTYQHRVLSGKPLPFSKLYLNKSIALKYVIAGAMGLIYAVLSLFFIKNSGGYSFGLSSFLQGFAKLASYFLHKNAVPNADVYYSLLFWGLILVVNIPLFFFSWKKIGHRFTLLTLTFLLVNTAAGLGFDQIPGINKVYLFGDTTMYVGTCKWAGELAKTGIQILPFGVSGDLLNETLFGIYPSVNYIRPLILIVTTIAYAFVAVFAFAILFIVGGSTAGTDFFSTYLSGRSRMNIATFFFILNLLCITLGATIGSFIPTCIECPQCAKPEFFFSSNYIATIISLAVFSTLYRKIYPTGYRCKVEVYSTKHLKIRDRLYRHNYIHGSNVHEVTGGYSNKKYGKFSTVCSYIELPLLIQEINKVDPDSTIVILKVAGIDGPFVIKKPGTN